MAKKYNVVAAFKGSLYDQTDNLVDAKDKTEARKKFLKMVRDNGGVSSDIKIFRIVEMLPRTKLKKLIKKKFN